MIVLRTDFYFDGGTCKISTDEGDFYLDRRLSVQGTKDECSLWVGYPGKEGAYVVNDRLKDVHEAMLLYCCAHKSSYQQANEMVVTDMEKNWKI